MLFREGVEVLKEIATDIRAEFIEPRPQHFPGFEPGIVANIAKNGMLGGGRQRIFEEAPARGKALG